MIPAATHYLVFAFYVASFWVILLLNHPQQQQNLWILCHFLSETRRGSAEQSPPDPEIFCMNVAVSCVSYFRKKQPPKIEICYGFLYNCFFIFRPIFVVCVFFSWSLIPGCKTFPKKTFRTWEVSTPLKNMNVKNGFSFPPIFGLKNTKIFELPPPRIDALLPFYHMFFSGISCRHGKAMGKHFG